MISARNGITATVAPAARRWANSIAHCTPQILARALEDPAAGPVETRPLPNIAARLDRVTPSVVPYTRSSILVGCAHSSFAVLTEGCRLHLRPKILLFVLLSTAALAPQCKPVQGPSAQLLQFAGSFVPFRAYSSSNCFEAWDDAASLLAALELNRRGQRPDLAITNGEAESYVGHMAKEVLDQFYDPDAPNGWGPCIGWVRVPLPDPPSGVAAMTYMLKEFGAGWSQSTVDAIRRAIHLPDWQFDVDTTYVYNKMIPFPAMHLLFGEGQCHAPSWERGWSQLRHAYRQHMLYGGFEANDRHYTMFHLANLGMILEGLDTPTPKSMAVNLFDLKVLLSAHLYMPGGHIGVLNTRMGKDPYYFPGTQREKDMGPMLESLAVRSDFQYAPNSLPARASVVIAEILRSRRPVPPRIRALFREKSEEHDAWWLMRSSKGSGRYPGTLSNLGESGRFGFAWQVHNLPGGVASMGSGYGEWALAAGNSEGVAVRCATCEQGFAFLYQWQPCAAGDTDDQGDALCSSAGSDAATQQAPLYDFERMQVNRSRITLFDPRERPTRWAGGGGLTVVRGHELSQTWLTNWDHPSVGGEKIFPTPGGWYVGRVGDVFVAYRPLGEDISSTQMDGATLSGPVRSGLGTFFQMQGRSGGITEIALADDFPGDTLANFADAMDARFWSFTADGPNGGPVAEVDFTAADGAACRMKLEYMGVGGLPGKERRYIDCSTQLGTQYVEQSEAEFFAALHGGTLIASPYVDYDQSSDILRVPDPAGEDLVYDFGGVRTAAATIVAPDGCDGRAYLELAESEALLETTAGNGIPNLDLTVSNTGFADTSSHIEFIADDCTAGPGAPNGDWLLAPDDVSLAPGTVAPLQVFGSVEGCDQGEFQGELTVKAVAGNAAEVRLPVWLTVGP